MYSAILALPSSITTPCAQVGVSKPPSQRVLLDTKKRLFLPGHLPSLGIWVKKIDKTVSKNLHGPDRLGRGIAPACVIGYQDRRRDPRTLPSHFPGRCHQ